jgi:hypothetical protein
LADLLGLELWVEPAQEEEEELPDLPGVSSLQLQPLQVLLLQHTHKDHFPYWKDMYGISTLRCAPVEEF